MRRRARDLLLLLLLILGIFVAGCSPSDKDGEQPEENYLLYQLSKDGTAYTVQGNPMYRSMLTEISIPAEKDGIPVTTIENNGFSEFQVLKTVTIPDTVTTIKNYAFEKCPALESIVIPNTVKKLGEYAFNECTALKSVTIGSGVGMVGNDCFYGCTALKQVTFSEGLQTIGKEAFCRCESLLEVHFPETLKTIGEQAFAYCKSLTEVKLPASVSSIGEFAFGYNNSSDGSYEGKLMAAYFYGDKPNGINQAFGYSWDPDDFVVYVPSEYYKHYENATDAADWIRCVVNTGKLKVFEISEKPY